MPNMTYTFSDPYYVGGLDTSTNIFHSEHECRDVTFSDGSVYTIRDTHKPDALSYNVVPQGQYWLEPPPFIGSGYIDAAERVAASKGGPALPVDRPTVTHDADVSTAVMVDERENFIPGVASTATVVPAVTVMPASAIPPVVETDVGTDGGGISPSDTSNGTTEPSTDTTTTDVGEDSVSSS